MDTRKNFVDANKNSRLHIAIMQKDYELAGTLLDEGADITIVNKDGFTPIGLAAKLNYFSYVNLIASKRNNIALASYVGHQEALLKCLQSGAYNSVVLLLRAGTPLRGYKVGESFISRYGVNKSCIDYEPLHFAVTRNDSSFTDLLLTYGADANHGHESPLQFAKRIHSTACVQAIDTFLKTNLTGSGIYTALVSKAMSEKDIELYGEFKEAVFAHILTIENRDDRIAALNYAKDKQTQLGSFFWLQRGFNSPTLETGILKRIVDQLAEENRLMQTEAEQQVILQQQYLQQQQMMYTYNMGFFNPNAYVQPTYIVPVEQAPVVQESLIPVYNPTFTSRMNELPKVSDLPALPKKSESPIRAATVRERGY